MQKNENDQGNATVVAEGKVNNVAAPVQEDGIGHSSYSFVNKIE